MKYYCLKCGKSADKNQPKFLRHPMSTLHMSEYRLCDDHIHTKLTYNDILKLETKGN